MSKRRLGWGVGGLLVIGAGLLLVPGSPWFIPQLLDDRGHHNGHSTSFWVAHLDHEDSDHRIEAIRAIGMIGTKANKSVPKLAALMGHDPNPYVRREASLALTKMDNSTKDVLPELVISLHDPEPLIRMNVLRVLMRLRTDAHPAIPALIEAIKDETNQTNLATFTFTIQELAILVLGYASHGTTDGLPTLREYLPATVPIDLRLAALRSLGHVGPEARTEVPALQALLKDTNREIKQAAHDALEKITAQPVAMLPDGPEPEVARLELPEDERVYLWDVEHHGNVLVKHGFGPLAQAIKNNDAAALQAFCAKEFQGTTLHQPASVGVRNAVVTVERQTDAGTTTAHTRATFVAWLLQQRALFKVPPSVKCALMTLSPEVRGKVEARWNGMGQLRMTGEAIKGAPAEVVITFRYTIDAPTEERLSQGAWLHAAHVTQVNRGQATQPLFAEVAEERGLNVKDLHDNWTATKFHITPGGIYVCDYNHDGYLDVLVTDVTGPTLYQGGAGGKFTDVTDGMKLPRFVSTLPAAAWVDLDRDGWEDLIYSGRVFRNDHGKQFLDVTEFSTLKLPTDANGYAVADYDKDGRLDVYITRTGKPGSNSWLDGNSGDLRGNALYRNKGNWIFEDVTRRANVSGGRRSTFAAAWLDANNDTWPDLYIANEFGNGVLMLNAKNGVFTEHLLNKEPVDFGTMGLTVGDINNDGQIDIYCANMYSKAGTRVIGNMRPDTYKPEVMKQLRRFVAGSQLHINRGNLAFDHLGKEMGVAAVGWAYGASLADLDNDGWLDLYATAGYISRDRDKPDG